MNAHQRRVERRRLLRGLTSEADMSPRVKTWHGAFLGLWRLHALDLLHRTIVGEVFVNNMRVTMAPILLSSMDPNYPERQGHFQRHMSIYVSCGPEVLRLQLHLPVRSCAYRGEISAVCQTRGSHARMMSTGYPIRLLGQKETTEARISVLEDCILAGFCYAFEPAAPAFQDFRAFLARRGVVRRLPKEVEGEIVRAMLTEGRIEPCTNSTAFGVHRWSPVTTTPPLPTSPPLASSAGSWPFSLRTTALGLPTRSQASLKARSSPFAPGFLAPSDGAGSKPEGTLAPSTLDPSEPTTLPSPKPTSNDS